MKPADNIRSLIKQSHVTTGPQADERILTTALADLEKLRQKRSAASEPNVWRTIMESRITKLGTAAVIIIAVALVVYYSGGSVGLTTIAFADIAEAMKNVPWMHQSINGFQQGASGPAETWFGFEAKMAAAKWADGKVTFYDGKAERKYEYEPQDNSLAIDYAREEVFPAYLSSPIAAIEGMHKALKELGAEITTRSGKYKGRQVQIQEIVLSPQEQHQPTQAVTLYIRRDSKLLLAAHARVTDANGRTITDGEITFSYPQTGPASIYDMGVPRDAKIIDKLPQPAYQAIWDKYRQCRADATGEYIAVITHADRFPSDVITMVDVDYKCGRKHRWERHSVFKMGEQFDEFWTQYKEQLGSSFDALLACMVKDREEGKGSMSVYVYDGQYSRNAVRRGLGGDAGKWKHYKKHYSPGDPGLPIGSLGDVGWPYIGKEGHILEDEYSKANGLVCIERLQQGSVQSGSVSPPARFLFYLDPQKDYLCSRKVTEWCPDAEWQEDKNWLNGVDPDKIGDGSITIEDITEFKKTPNGRWYPKVIVVKATAVRKDYKHAPLKARTTKTVHIQTAPQFPDGIFDIEKLPGQ
ncbi:MAG: LolA family protein [Planctomycetota bacterium]|jgi:hypothetical protein